MPDKGCHLGNWPAGTIAARLRASAAFSLSAIFILAMTTFSLAARALQLEAQVPVIAILFLAMIFAFAINGLPAHPHPRFGYANTVTAIRGALASFAAALVFFADHFTRSGALISILFTMSGLSMVLDGLDGYLARRFSQQSAFGARFDMEMDAFLILTLSGAAFILGKAGIWVLAIGLMRYAFVLGQWMIPRLHGALHPSFRRKSICVLQVVALLLLLAPFVAPPWSQTIAALALAMLIYSFAVDVIYLLQRSHPQ